MNKTIQVLIAMILSISITHAGSIGKVSFFVGKARIKPKETTDWKDARMNLPVAEGDRIETGKADRLEVTLKDGSVIRIAEESDITLDCPNGKTIAPSVEKGRIWCNIKKLGQRNYGFEVTSGTATAAIRGTVFRMDNNTSDSMTSVLVYDGKVDVGPGKQLEKAIASSGAKQERTEISGPQEVPGPFEVTLMDWVAIVKGQRIDVQKNGKYNKFKFNDKQDSKDEWVKFNTERDLAVNINHEQEKK